MTNRSFGKAEASTLVFLPLQLCQIIRVYFTVLGFCILLCLTITFYCLLHDTFYRQVGCAEQYADAPALLVVSNSENVVKFNKGPGRLSTLWRVQQDGNVDLDYNCIQVDNSYSGSIPELPSEDPPIVTEPIKKPSDGSTTGGKCLTDSSTGNKYCEDPSQCCSQYMYCGPSSDPDYCGDGCLGGPCWSTGANPTGEDRDDTTGNSLDEDAGVTIQE